MSELSARILEQIIWVNWASTTDSQVAKPELQREPKQCPQVHLFINPQEVWCLALWVLVNGKDGVAYSGMPLLVTYWETAKFWCPPQPVLRFIHSIVFSRNFYNSNSLSLQPGSSDKTQQTQYLLIPPRLHWGYINPIYTAQLSRIICSKWQADGRLFLKKSSEDKNFNRRRQTWEGKCTLETFPNTKKHSINIHTITTKNSST